MPEPCDICNGTGQVSCDACEDGLSTCDHCGHVHDCEQCDGTGYEDCWACVDDDEPVTTPTKGEGK